MLTAELKDELSHLQVTQYSARRASLSTWLRMSGKLYRPAKRTALVLKIETETEGLARHLRRELRDLYGVPCEAYVTAITGNNRANRFAVRVTEHADALARQTGILDARGRPILGLPAEVLAGNTIDAEAVWRGAFLAGGTVTEPCRTNVLDITCPTPEVALALVSCAKRIGITAKQREVREENKVLIRDQEHIGGLITRMGGSETRLLWEERRMRREARIAANRLASFDDANMRRSEKAAADVAARCERALEILGDGAPDHLAAVGRLRIENPAASLEELGEIAEPPLTKDAVAGRIRRLLSAGDRALQSAG